MIKTIALIAILLFQQTANANVGGEWFAQLTLPLGETNFTMFLVQKGGEVTGYMLNEVGQFDLKGSINRDQVKFDWEYPDGGGIVKISFSGKVDRNSISGVAKVGNVGEGAMSAQRK